MGEKGEREIRVTPELRSASWHLRKQLPKRLHAETTRS
jgi:hypothetical protein